MTETEIAAGIIAALEAAETKHPGWTTDAVHAVAVLAEESGELVQAANDFQHAPTPGNRVRMREEALQVGAMVYRILLHLDEYEGNPAAREAAIRIERAKERTVSSETEEYWFHDPTISHIQPGAASGRETPEKTHSAADMADMRG